MARKTNCWIENNSKTQKINIESEASWRLSELMSTAEEVKLYYRVKRNRENTTDEQRAHKSPFVRCAVHFGRLCIRVGHSPFVQQNTNQCFACWIRFFCWIYSLRKQTDQLLRMNACLCCHFVCLLFENCNFLILLMLKCFEIHSLWIGLLKWFSKWKFHDSLMMAKCIRATANIYAIWFFVQVAFSFWSWDTSPDDLVTHWHIYYLKIFSCY